jgi:hypothetical protein
MAVKVHKVTDGPDPLLWRTNGIGLVKSGASRLSCSIDYGVNKGHFAIK